MYIVHNTEINYAGSAVEQKKSHSQVPMLLKSTHFYLFQTAINHAMTYFNQRWPTEVLDLRPAVKTLFDLLCLLGDRVLCAMALGLGLVSWT